MLKYVVCLCNGCDGCCVFVCIVTRGAVGARVWECFVMQMLYVCVHPVAGRNAAFCMTCRLLMLVEDVRGDHMDHTTKPTDSPTTRKPGHNSRITQSPLPVVNHIRAI